MLKPYGGCIFTEYSEEMRCTHLQITEKKILLET